MTKNECPTQKIIVGEEGDSYDYVNPWYDTAIEPIVLGSEIDGSATLIVAIVIDADDYALEWLTSDTEPRSYALGPGNRLVIHESFVSHVKHMLID